MEDTPANDHPSPLVNVAITVSAPLEKWSSSMVDAEEIAAQIPDLVHEIRHARNLSAATFSTRTETITKTRVLQIEKREGPPVSIGEAIELLGAVKGMGF